MSGSNGHVRRAELAAVLKGVASGDRQAAINNVAREIIKLHDRLVDLEVDRGIRKSRPVRKAGLSLGEQLREIARDDGVDVAKRSRWSGLL